MAAETSSFLTATGTGRTPHRHRSSAVGASPTRSRCAGTGGCTRPQMTLHTERHLQRTRMAPLGSRASTCRAEHRFRVGFDVGYRRPGEGSDSTQFLLSAFQHGIAHGVAVVGLQDQWLAAVFADLLPQTVPASHIRRNGWISCSAPFRGHVLAAPDNDHHVDVQLHSAHGCWQESDVPAPHPIRSCGSEPRHVLLFPWWSCAPTAVG